MVERNKGVQTATAEKSRKQRSTKDDRLQTASPKQQAILAKHSASNGSGKRSKGASPPSSPTSPKIVSGLKKAIKNEAKQLSPRQVERSLDSYSTSRYAPSGIKSMISDCTGSSSHFIESQDVDLSCQESTSSRSWSASDDDNSSYKSDKDDHTHDDEDTLDLSKVLKKHLGFGRIENCDGMSCTHSYGEDGTSRGSEDSRRYHYRTDSVDSSDTGLSDSQLEYDEYDEDSLSLSLNSQTISQDSESKSTQQSSSSIRSKRPFFRLRNNTSRSAALSTVSEYPSEYDSKSGTTGITPPDLATMASEITWERDEEMGYEVQHHEAHTRSPLSSASSYDTDDSDLSRKMSKARRSNETRASSKSSRPGDASEPIDVTDYENIAEYDLSAVGSRHNRLHHVQYVEHMDEASSNRGISVVEPITRSVAQDAFVIAVPHSIPVEDHLRDDISSLGGALSVTRPQQYQQQRNNKGGNSNRNDRNLKKLSGVNEDDEADAHRVRRIRSMSPSTNTKSQAPSSHLTSSQHQRSQQSQGSYVVQKQVMGHDMEQAMPPPPPVAVYSCLSPRSDLELFFIALITVSILTLIILLTLILTQK
jgi:hypothetical protein